MNDDLKELLTLLNFHNVEYLIIGAHAVAFHGRPRFTQDLDVWVNPSIENSSRLRDALSSFGTPIGDTGAEKFAGQDRQMVRLGVRPNMVDLLNFAGTLPFEEVWSRRIAGDMDGIPVFFPSTEDLIDMKRAAGRPQDIADIDRLTDGS